VGAVVAGLVKRIPVEERKKACEILIGEMRMEL
jgi:hypothetical protein